MRTSLLFAMGVAAVVAVTGTPTLAQDAPALTVQDVSAAQPFGDIDVTLTMLDPRTISAWAAGLDEDKQAELRARCQVMVDNPRRYDIAPRTFCATLLGT